MASKAWEAKWEKRKEIGGGGQGKTSLVVSKDNPHRQGVLKTLNRGKSEQARGRMHREVVTLDTLANTDVKVPQVLDDNTGEYKDENVELYFVMEYIPGKTLKDEMTERGRLSLEKAAAVAMDLCKTVAAAHQNDVLHRDLKPDNIIVRDFETADLVIVDYGLSYKKETPQDLTHVDEQFRNRFLSLPETNTLGSDRRDKRSDVTAVCAVLYYCITGFEPGHLRDGSGRPPHRRQGYSVRQVLQGNLRCEQLEMLFDRAFALEVENRFQSCEELISRLESVLKPSFQDEDPTVVSAEIGKLLLLHDRKTLLAEFAKHAQRLLQKMQQLTSAMAQRISHPFQLTIVPWTPLPENTFPMGLDQLGAIGFPLNVRVHPHKLSRSVLFTVGSKGNQCVLLRGYLVQPDKSQRAIRQKPHALAPQWEELLWFNPDEQPSDENLQKILNQSINKLIRDLRDEILPS